ncbi:DUF4376 domain-containing protein [Pasteurella multocida]|uniref:DUF4376 domain-containing protein n=1 Tax=Pasteurella multocida TaxID=747 RepID=UPI002ED2E607|nr:DUF4376 domain-containing protein [Pasteurella multocida]
MKVYFLKNDLNQYQIFPKPSNIDDFIELDLEIENESILDTHCIVESNGEFKLVSKPESALQKWDGEKWVIDELKLAEQQNEVWERIKEKRYKNGLGGVYIERVGKWFQTGEEEKTKYLGLDKVIDKINEIDWKCADNTFVKMNRTLLDEIFLQMVVTENADHINAEKHRIEMMKSTNPLDYNFSTGWSANYEQV